MLRRLLLAAAAASLSLATLAADPPGDTVLVQKGDVTVTVDDLLAALEKLPEDQRYTFRADLERITNGVSGIYVSRELAAQARAQGIDKEPLIQRRLKLAEENLLGQVYIDRFEKAIVYPDYTGKAKEIYTANLQNYQMPETVTLRHILVSFQGRTPEEAKRRIDEVRAKLLAGDEFLLVAREYSNDPTVRANDGFKQGPYNLLPPELVPVAKTIPLKQVSEPVRGADGYSIIIVQERLPSYTIPFEKVKRELIENERNKYRVQLIDQKLGTITKSKDIVIYTDRIAALKTEVDRDRLTELHKEKVQQDALEKERIMKSTKPPGF
ncbi:MAG TPA: peptidylprolyl isomerase [Usitatibacter sp.]|jgi:parvulin-like peptidyl-prolyl isomerase